MTVRLFQSPTSRERSQLLTKMATSFDHRNYDRAVFAARSIAREQVKAEAETKQFKQNLARANQHASDESLRDKSSPAND